MVFEFLARLVQDNNKVKLIFGYFLLEHLLIFKNVPGEAAS
jgi:hypothetical protein